MSNSSRNSSSSTSSSSQQRRKSSAGPIAFFAAVFIIALGLIQLVSTFHTYALNLSELNSLKKQEASLVAQKQELENDIARWDDDAYVTAQARERLGYVFPGEQAIRVEHPEAVTGNQDTQNKTQQDEQSQRTTLPWYSELAFSFGQSDTEQESSAKATPQQSTDQENTQDKQSSSSTQQEDTQSAQE